MAEEEKPCSKHRSNYFLNKSGLNLPNYKYRRNFFPIRYNHSCLILKILSMLVVFSLMGCCESKYVEGVLRTKQRWAFLTRFCFLSGEGKFKFDVSYDILRGSHQKLILYYDEPHQWDAAYLTDTSCEEKEAIADVHNNQYINLTLYSKDTECEIMRSNWGNVSTYQCTGFRSFNSRRERWWYIAVSNCDSSEGLQLTYRLTLTNGFNFWYKHFSADEFYILRTNLAAMVLEIGILFLSILAAAELKKHKHLHTTYRLYMYAVIFNVLGLLLLCIHYARYGVDGVGIPICKFIGRIFISINTVITVLYLLLMGKGFNITRGRLRQMSAVRLSTFMTFFAVTYASLFIYEQTRFDPGRVLYIYESYPGYGLVVLRLLGCLMFFYSCFFTVKHYPEKASFYVPFFIFYTLWFISGPIIILISNLVIDKWVREKVVNGVERAVELLGQFFFLFITRPGMANSNFPYHVRTSQITAMQSNELGRYGNNSIDKFASNNYAPNDYEYDSKNYSTTPDLFVVSGTVEMRPAGRHPNGGGRGSSAYDYTPNPNMSSSEEDHQMTRTMRYKEIKKSTVRRPSAELRSLPVLPPLESGLKDLPNLKSEAKISSQTVYTVHKRQQSAKPIPEMDPEYEPPKQPAASGLAMNTSSTIYTVHKKGKLEKSRSTEKSYSPSAPELENENDME